MSKATIMKCYNKIEDMTWSSRPITSEADRQEIEMERWRARLAEEYQREVDDELSISPSRTLQLDDATVEKLIMLADSIDAIAVNDQGSVHVKFKKHVVLESPGHMVRYTPNGAIVDKAKMLSLNPLKEKEYGGDYLHLAETLRLVDMAKAKKYRTRR